MQMSEDERQAYYQKLAIAPLMTAWNHYLNDQHNGFIDAARKDLRRLAATSCFEDVMKLWKEMDTETECKIAIMLAGHGYVEAESLGREKKRETYLERRNEEVHEAIILKLREHGVNLRFATEQHNNTSTFDPFAVPQSY